MADGPRSHTGRPAVFGGLGSDGRRVLDEAPRLAVAAPPLERDRRQVGPKDASWPMHSCGNTACYARLELAQPLGQLGVFLTSGPPPQRMPGGRRSTWSISADLSTPRAFAPPAASTETADHRAWRPCWHAACGA
jgi:hypothetical protein